MEKSRSLTMLGGKGYMVRPKELPETVRMDMRIVDVQYTEQSPFVYCEYWTLDQLVKNYGFALLYFAAMAFLMVGGLLWEQQWMLWGAAILCVVFVISGVFTTWEVFRDIVNSRSGGPARKDWQ